jgi:hypothetical protein
MKKRGPDDPGGIPACSRGPSEERATPPATRKHDRTPAGVPANTQHAIDSHVPSLPHCFRHKKPGAPDRAIVEAPPARISRRCRSRAGCHATRHRWNRRPRSSSDRPQSNPLSFRFHARLEKKLIGLGLGNDPRPFFQVAGGLCGVHGQRFGQRLRAGLHRGTGRTSSQKIFPRGTGRVSSKIGHRIRCSLPRLKPVFGWHPSGMRSSSVAQIRWCRFAQPPATG